VELPTLRERLLSARGLGQELPDLGNLDAVSKRGTNSFDVLSLTVFPLKRIPSSASRTEPCAAN